MKDLAALIEKRYKELLDDAEIPECAACGRKPMSAAQMISALSGATRWLASQAPVAPGGVAQGSGFEEEENA